MQRRFVMPDARERPATAEQIHHMVDDTVVSGIMRTQASAAQVLQAVQWFRGGGGLEDPIGVANAQLYSEELGLDLASGRERDLFLWFLASLLFGQRISEEIARNTYRAFVRHGLTSPQKILAAGWAYLVNPIMREGGYVRYDESKSRKLLSACRMLVELYGGRLSRLHAAAGDDRDLERRLLDFYGVGPVTANIFLRELRPYWRKADPAPLPFVRALAQRMGIDLDRHDRHSLDFARLEAGLVRLRRVARRNLAT
jgi:hypothetical protein